MHLHYPPPPARSVDLAADRAAHHAVDPAVARPPPRLAVVVEYSYIMIQWRGPQI